MKLRFHTTDEKNTLVFNGPDVTTLVETLKKFSELFNWTTDSMTTIHSIVTAKDDTVYNLFTPYAAQGFYACICKMVSHHALITKMAVDINMTQVEADPNSDRNDPEVIQPLLVVHAEAIEELALLAKLLSFLSTAVRTQQGFTIQLLLEKYPELREV